MRPTKSENAGEGVVFGWFKKKGGGNSMRESSYGGYGGQQTGKTKVLIKYNVGFKNNLYIRGHGGGLSWNKGVMLKNIGPDEWVWEPNTPITDVEFKVLINDEKYEAGENHHITTGKLFQYSPRF
jgi:hypothetical protein